MAIPKTVSTSELAIVLGITTQGVGKLTEAKVLKREGRGLYDLADSVQRHTKHREAVATKQAGGGSGSFAQGKARKIWEEVRRLEDERKVRDGTFVELAKLEQHWTSIVGVFRNAALMIPKKCATIVMRCRDPGEAERELMKEVRGILTRISQTDYRPGIARSVS